MVIVNWNSLEFLKVAIGAVLRFSPSETRLVVIDNGSTDGSKEWLNLQPVTVISLHRNFGHGAALDLGVLAARTQNVVVLDVDAFPISENWLDVLVSMLDNGAHVAGAHGGQVLDRFYTSVPEGWGGRSFVHPCCLAIRMRRFVLKKLTFRKRMLGNRMLDPGEYVSYRERRFLGYLEPTSTVGPGALGTVFGGIVHHNFYGTRHGADASSRVDGISFEDSRRVWNESVASYLGAVSDNALQITTIEGP